MIKKLLQTLTITTLSLAAMLSISLLVTHSTSAADVALTVNSTGTDTDANQGDGICETLNSGECTLYAAVQEANANANTGSGTSHTITFEIPGAGLHTITEASPILYTTNKNVIINGYSEDDAVENTAAFPLPFNGTLRVEVKNIKFYSSSANRLEIRGLIMNSVEAGGTINLPVAGSELILSGNYVGTDPDGLVNESFASKPFPDAEIIIQGGSSATIGGPNAADRNVLTSSYSVVDCTVGSTLSLQGNYIGVGSDGVTNIGNLDAGRSGVIATDCVADIDSNFIENSTGAGIYVNSTSDGTQIVGNRIIGNYFEGISATGADNLIIGGTSSAERNIISGNNGSGINISLSSGHSIRGNYIGTGDDGVTALGNNVGGITLDQITNSTVGGKGANEFNIIAHNSGSGIAVDGEDSSVSILRNLIHTNDGLAIDLAANGVTENDQLDPDTGPNQLLNFAWRSTVEEAAGDTTVEFVTDLPAGDYSIEFFSNPSGADTSGHGEGEVYIGETSITSAGSGRESFSYLLTGVTGAADVSMTVTEDFGGGSYGATSEFGDQYIPSADLSLTKVLDNPEDYDQNGIVNYTITLTNSGPDSIDLNTLNGSGINPFATSMFFELLPPGHEVAAGVFTPFSPSGSPDVTCTWYGPGSASLAPFFADHINYSIMPCAYSGGSSELLEVDASYSVTIPITLANEAGLNFTNFALTSFGNGLDPSADEAVVGCAPDEVGDPDLISCLIPTGLNNFAYAGAPTDIELTKTLNNPEDVEVGATISYTVGLNNNGPGDINLANYYPSQSTSLFTDLYPGADLTYVSTSTPDIFCSDVGPGSYTFLGPGAEDHPDHQILSCFYTGDSQIVASGDSFEAVLNFTVDAGFSDNFINYVIHASTVADSDSSVIQSQLFGASEDVLDTLANNNFARTAFVPVPATDTVSEPDASATAGQSDLSATGRNTSLYILVALLLISAGATGYLTSIRRKTTHK